MNAPFPSPILPDRDMIATFYGVLFKHCDRSKFVIVKSFYPEQRVSPITGKTSTHTVPTFEARGIALNHPRFADVMFEAAVLVASHRKGASLVPPDCTFKGMIDGKWSAKQSDIFEGPSISVDVDKSDPRAAVNVLTGLLGPATIASNSGGTWTDPATGAELPRVHLRWRLARPARTEEELGMLKEVRWLAAKLVGGDTALQVVSQPLRLPGSLHTKRQPPVLTSISNISPQNEVDLRDSLRTLRAAWAATGGPAFQQRPPRKPGEKSFDGARPERDPDAKLIGDVKDVREAAELIPNGEMCWYDDWRKMGLAFWGATDGSADGLKAFKVWSAKNAEAFDPKTTVDVWHEISASPPSAIGAGTLMHYAKIVDPSWIQPSRRLDMEAFFEHPEPEVEAPSVEEPSAEAAGETQEPYEADDESEDDGRNSGALSEDMAAAMFAERHAGKLRYDHDRGVWLEWDGLRWKANGTSQAFHLARLAARDYGFAEDSNYRKQIGKAAFARAIERFARADPALAVTSEVWDQDPFLLGTPAGTVDLSTGRLRPARAEDGITKLAGVAPADKADCPLWLAFLDQATGGDAGMIRFLQQFVGYCLTGDVREHALLFIYGGGGNGKGLFLGVIQGIMAEYAATAAMDAFVATFGEKHSTDMAMLRGSRLVTASETDKGQKWAEARIKQLTGGDPITARFMRMDFFTYQPTFKLFVVGNHKPGLVNVDDAARRRFNLVPFLHKPAEPDRLLNVKLQAEWPGILRWMIEGCLDWQANGLVRPESVQAATDEYFAEQDVFGQWLDECCILTPGNQNQMASSAALFASWEQYGRIRHEPAESAKAFAGRLEALNLTSDKNIPVPSGKRVRGFRGIELKPEIFFDEDV